MFAKSSQRVQSRISLNCLSLKKLDFFLLRGRRPAQGSTGSADSSDGEHGLVKPEASQGSALLMT